MSLTNAERETVVRWAQDQSPAVVYTHDAKLMAQMVERGIKPLEEHVYEGAIVARTYELPRARLRLRVLALPRPRTEKQIAASAALGRRKHAEFGPRGKANNESSVANAASTGPNP